MKPKKQDKAFVTPGLKYIHSYWRGGWIIHIEDDTYYYRALIKVGRGLFVAATIAGPTTLGYDVMSTLEDLYLNAIAKHKTILDEQIQECLDVLNKMFFSYTVYTNREKLRQSGYTKLIVLRNDPLSDNVYYNVDSLKNMDANIIAQYKLRGVKRWKKRKI